MFSDVSIPLSIAPSNKGERSNVSSLGPFFLRLGRTHLTYARASRCCCEPRSPRNVTSHFAVFIYRLMSSNFPLRVSSSVAIVSTAPSSTPSPSNQMLISLDIERMHSSMATIVVCLIVWRDLVKPQSKEV